MPNTSIKNITELSEDSFTYLIDKMGYISCACYLIENNHLQLIISTKKNDVIEWPFSLDKQEVIKELKKEEFSWGWFKIDKISSLKKNIYAYYPDQEYLDFSIFFLVIKKPGKKILLGEPDSYFEALSKRIFWIINQKSISKQTKSLASLNQSYQNNIKRLIDHEIRTPLASLQGYFDLLEADSTSFNQFFNHIKHDIYRLSDVLKKIDAFFEENTSADIQKTSIIDIRSLVNKIKNEFLSLVKKDFPRRREELKISCLYASEKALFVKINEDMIKQVMFEILKNSASFPIVTKIEIHIYDSNDFIILDISDNGIGIAQGIEELIFTQFYQEPTEKIIKRLSKGLGIGLFIARKLVEQHFGQLYFVRQNNRIGLFRLVLPRCDEKKQDEDKISSKKRN